jgi:hypothetical protein
MEAMRNAYKDKKKGGVYSEHLVVIGTIILGCILGN